MDDVVVNRPSSTSIPSTCAWSRPARDYQRCHRLLWVIQPTPSASYATTSWGKPALYTDWSTPASALPWQRYPERDKRHEMTLAGIHQKVIRFQSKEWKMCPSSKEQLNVRSNKEQLKLAKTVRIFIVSYNERSVTWVSSSMHNAVSSTYLQGLRYFTTLLSTVLAITDIEVGFLLGHKVLGQ